ncbi:DUF4386 domain-containing protein [Sphaerisporangium aureirubrum]|uniref:DUF4386 domain-containing protein n=1 Tax=Sphaerisporangium aureirubrum TaxID=1544736 RepID=A0ABW1NB36_9ACTN
MAIAAEPRTTKRAPMDSTRRNALAAGVLYLITIVTSIPALLLYAPVLNDPDFIVGPGPDTGVLWGGILEMICLLACIGTAVVLFPTLRRLNEVAALGFVTARVLEAAIIVAGVISLFTVVTLRQNGAAGADAATLITTGNALVAFHNWTFLLGPGVIPALNALLLGYVLYRSRLVPRVIPAMGLIGAPLLLFSTTAVLFGLYAQVSAPSAIAGFPIFLWEGSLGVWLIVKGFKPSPIAADGVTAG